MRTLSKSKLMAFRQCPKRLWLEVHHPELRQDSSDSQRAFAVGNQVGDLARQLYDPDGDGVLVDPQTEGFDAAFARTQALLATDQPIFEAGVRAAGALAFADVLLPVFDGAQRAWRMVEVKSSSSVKDYHRDDAAIQTYVAKQAGVPLVGIALAHINNQWICPGNDDYHGLLVEQDLTTEAFARSNEVRDWITTAQGVASAAAAPDIHTGDHCKVPYECSFFAYCRSQEPQPQHSVDCLPRPGPRLKAKIRSLGLTELAQVADSQLNEIQRRVKACTLSGQIYFNSEGAAAALAGHALPAYFLDFETITFAIPIWKGTRPFQQIPFQFSVHQLFGSGEITHRSFLDLSGNDPSAACAEALIGACGEAGPVFVYSQSFEKSRINEMAGLHPQFAERLLAINERVVDLLPIARDHYYHPSQQGSWSIKRVLPAVCPDLNYDDLNGVKDGGMAMTAYLEAVETGTSDDRKAEIESQLIKYCALDTYAMVRLWSAFSGQRLKS